MLAQSPYQWLQELSQRAKQRAKGLPRHEKVEQLWRGVAFRLTNNNLITQLNEISEILPFNGRLAKVPGAKSWVKGLANIRGLLLPVIDLKGCIEGKPITIERHTRLLIINQAGHSAGLLVDEVFGIKHFPEHLRVLDKPCEHAWLVPYAKGTFTNGKKTWTVFDMHTLAQSELFLKAAL
jgi:twitching motility protein PilI